MKRCVVTKPDMHDMFDVVGEYTQSLLDEQALPWSRKLGVYHPSSIRGCRRALYYDRIGLVPHPRFTLNNLALFDIGHALHNHIQAKLLLRNPDAIIEREAVSEALHIAGSCDMHFVRKDWLLEIKTVGSATFKGLVGPTLDAVYQITCYMWMLDVPRAQLLYVNRDNGVRRLFKVRFDMAIFNKITDIIMYVEEFVEARVPPEREPNVGWGCYSCGHREVCGK